jgi:hypothetical protein
MLVEEQSLTRFAAGSGSQVQWDPTSSDYGRPPRQFAGLCRTGKSPLPVRRLLFINITRSAFRNPHFPPAFRRINSRFSFVMQAKPTEDILPLIGGGKL